MRCPSTRPTARARWPECMGDRARRRRPRAHCRATSTTRRARSASWPAPASSRRHPDDYRIVAGEHDVDDDHRQERARLVHTRQHNRDISMDRGSVDPTRRIVRMPQDGMATGARLGAFYAASFLVVGIQTPFWPVWLAGRIRVWGSLSFIIAAISTGALLGGNSSAAVPGNTVLALVLVASALLLLACCWIPPGAAAAGRARWAALGRFAADRRFWLFVASGAALQSSHQLYYGFGTLYWRELGFADPVIGVLWAEGVVAEIVLFWYSARLVARLGPLGLMALGGIAGVLRWSLMGIVPGLAAAAVLQLLHALTFGASHLGAMYFMARSVPPGTAASAQSLYAAVSAGLGSGFVMLVAGALYGAYGGQAYLFMAVLSAAGLGGVVALAGRR